MVSASLLVIGDEILSGKVQDENSVVLARTLFDRGVRLTRIEVIPDDIDLIASSVLHMSKESHYVFTSGGIGPTHDDKTYDGIAKAFGLRLEYHEETLAGFREYQALYAPDKVLNEARKKMALLPTPCEIIMTEGLWVPMVVVHNVYVLPGVPSLFARLLEGVAHRFNGPAIERVLIYTRRSEGDIAQDLSAVQDAFPSVAIGSYPKYGISEYQVMVSFEGTDKKAVEEAARRVEIAIDGFRDFLRD